MKRFEWIVGDDLQIVSSLLTAVGDERPSKMASVQAHQTWVKVSLNVLYSCAVRLPTPL